MGYINKDELSNELLEYMEGLGLTEEQVNQIVADALVDINEKNANQDEAIAATQTKTDNNLATNDKTIVGAINELFQNANNGKELIANAIGEPVSSEDTFQAMSNDINGLLSTFKTNMMNNGITVEANDKFKNLIDKIATMVEEGSGKGIRMINGTTTSDRNGNIVVTNLPFKPTVVFTYQNEWGSDGIKYPTMQGAFDDVQLSVRSYNSGGTTAVSMITPRIYDNGFETNTYAPNCSCTYYAIGVGEEDTTLRDSLASILTDEGVSVTEEDDMASLISKVDEEFANKVAPQVTDGTDKVLCSYTTQFVHNSNTITDYEIGYTFFDGYVSIGYYWYTPDNTYGLSHLTFITTDKDGNIIYTSETFDDNTGFPTYYNNVKVAVGGKLIARVDTFSAYCSKELKGVTLYCSSIEF